MYSFLRFLCKPKTILYFAPHQDDELLTLGTDICKMLQEGYSVHVILCSDGSKSSIRQKLHDGKACRHHPGLHQYALSIPEFIAARDQEFTASCLALGVPAKNIHISPIRAEDGSLTVEQGEAILLDALSRLPSYVSVRTLSPLGGKQQHRDHTNLGQAALNLYRRGVFRDLQLFIEPYCLESCQEAYPLLELNHLHGDGADAQLTEAVAAYSRWAPEEGRYAIGYHSVNAVFREFLKDPVGYWHLPLKE